MKIIIDDGNEYAIEPDKPLWCPICKEEHEATYEHAYHVFPAGNGKYEAHRLEIKEQTDE